MKPLRKSLYLSSIVIGSTISSPGIADSFSQAITSGKAYTDIRLRYETVEQGNSLDDASALTLRTRLGYKTGSYHGFSALIEFEDSRIVAGEDEYSVPPTGFQTGDYSVIADPETSELDQAFIQYKNKAFTAKLGPQVLTLDNHRFVGHVGWRQDRQTFDAFNILFTPSKAASISASYIYERNRIFAEEQDQKSKDVLLNASYKLALGKLTGYAYLLEDDFGANATRDTYGIRFTGKQTMGKNKLLYTAEYATQDFENDSGADFSTDYLFLEAGLAVSGIIFKLGYESLGSDDGDFGFGTPLATLHKFNGFADIFLGTPNQGLVDTYLSASSKIGPGKLSVIYHDFQADESSSTIDDLGTELDVVYGFKFNKHYNAGIKYADYSADDFGVDTEKLSVWIGAKF